MAFVGPGYLVAVGYMDPGNWATDLAGGSAFGYTLLSVVLASSLMAMLLQTLSARLGIAAGLDLAQACRARYGRATNLALWVLCELAIIACDLAEVLGTAIALKLLFGLPLLAGVVITAFDVMLLLALQRFGFRKLEAFVATLLVVVAGCFAYEVWLARPDWGAVASGFVTRAQILANQAMLYIAIGILGATVMPHNLYLHSSVVQTRRLAHADKRSAIRYATVDTVIALGFALLINAAILILAAATFHSAGRTGVADIEQAYRLLSPMLGAGAASVVIALVGERATTGLLVLSEVVLSLQLPFAVIPLVAFTGDRQIMGDFASPLGLRIAAWAVAAVIVVLNLTLLVRIVSG